MMDGNNWRPAQGETDPNMDASDWRVQLTVDSRQRIVNKILETLKKHLPIPGQENLVELKKIAVRFEEKIYTSATSKNDYLKKISMKMLTMESKSQGTTAGLNALQSVSAGGNQNPADLVGTQAQQQLPISMGDPSLPRQPVLQSNLQNTLTSNAVQNSANLPPAMQSGLAQTGSVVGQSSNLQPTISGSVVSSAVGSGIPGNILTSSQRQQLQGRQQGLAQQQMNSQQYNMYQQQLLKQKLQPQVQPSLLQSHLQQQQQPLQPNQMPGPQPSLMQISSGLPAAQATLQQTQPSLMQPTAQTGLQQKQTPMQQPVHSGIQQHQHSLIRQQQLSQQSSTHQAQQAQIGQQMLSSSQQQQLLGQQPRGTGMAQTQLLGQQQNSVSDIQQQRLVGHHQQQLMGQQNNVANLHQHMSTQTNVSNMQPHQHGIRMQPQQPQQQTSGTMLSSQSQQVQPLPQQFMSQLQPQTAHIQQQMGLQQQPNSLQREMQQRMQTSNSLLQQQSAIDQQKQQLFQSQRGLAEAATAIEAMGLRHGVIDWQEDTFQKIKSMKEMYAPDLTDMYNRISQKCQQADAQGSKTVEQMEKLKYFKGMIEKMLQFLNMSKSSIQLLHKERLALYEKHIVTFLSSHRLKKPASAQGQPQHPQSMVQSHTSVSQQLPAQISNLQQHDSHMNQMQSLNLQASVTSSMQHGGSLAPTHLGVSQTQQNINSLQQASSLDLVHGNSLSSLPQGVMSSLHQNTVSGSQQAGINTLSQCGVNVSQTNLSILQQNANVLQHNQPHMKPQVEQQQQQMLQQQQQQMIQNQQLKQQFQQRQMHPQLIQQQQKQIMLHPQQLQQQQLNQQQKQQISQLHQMNNDVNDMKSRHGAAVMKAGMFSQHQQPGSRPAYYHQQMKAGATFPISSPQLLQSQSPQISQHSSPQIDQQNVLPSLTKAGTPQQTANSPCVVPSPSSLLSQSPVVGDSERHASGLSSFSNTGNVGHMQLASAQSQVQTLAISPSGISASPLLAELSGAEGNLAGAATTFGGKSSGAERPVDRLINAVRSMSPKALSSSISDIGSVISLVDRIAGSAPGSGSRAAIGEDLAGMTKCRLQARYVIQPDGSPVTSAKKMRRHTTAMPLNDFPSAGSANNDSPNMLCSETSELESTATSGFKKHKMEGNHALQEEIREVNRQLIDTVVEFTDNDECFASAAECEGTVVRCCFNAVAVSPILRSQLVSARMLPIPPLRILVPPNYPSCSPVLLDKLQHDSSKGTEDLLTKVNSRFSAFLRTLPQPLSVGSLARAWDVCAREVIAEYAQARGGGTFTSKYGAWESCISA